MFGLRCRDCLCTYIDPPISTSLDFIEKVTNFWQVVGTIKMLQTDYYGRREKNYWKAIGEMKNKRSFFCTVDLKDSNVMAIGNTTNIVIYKKKYGLAMSPLPNFTLFFLK